MVQFAGIGLAAMVIVAVATSTASRRIGQREAIADARATTLVRAQGLVEPVITDRLAAGDPDAAAAVGRVVESKVIDGSLVRVKIWTGDGVIVYSDERRLLGSTYALGADELAALRSGLIEAEVSNLARPENRFERSFGKLLEVYLPVRAPDGTRLLFEAYYRYDAVAASGRRIWNSFAPVSLGALVALGLLQTPLAWSLAHRLRQRQREREALLQRALDASDVERRRIANDLHDGVVQELAGVAYTLAGAAREAGLTPAAAGALDAASAAVRSSITSLRASLVDIHPPNLAEHGLRAALDDLAGDASTSTLEVTVDAPALPASLPRSTEDLLYRVVREALRNVTRHAAASSAVVRGEASNSRASVSVTDDGGGFDPGILDAKAAAGHLGLRGLEGVVHDAGGTIKVDSEPGRGTTVLVEVPIR
jgi:signal transduction histidine kinase